MDNTNVNNQEIPKPSRKTGKIPQTDINLNDVAQKVAKSWLNKPLTLEWMKPEDFKALVDVFNRQLQSRLDEGNNRPQITAKLKELDKKIDQHISYVKNYLMEEFGKGNELAYYAQFGIMRVNAMFKLPNDRNERLIALQTLLKGITERGYQDKPYGTAFWQPIVEEYGKLLTDADNKVSAISSKVSSKNQSKEQVKKVLNALIYLIRAHYPDTYASELRVWGFQKEKY
ncbi:MAG: hypothetical protein NW226_08120 [Microscillaceae bacterium]|nr:hypothetical protein [Microscillaceae bacterium]